MTPGSPDGWRFSSLKKFLDRLSGEPASVVLEVGLALAKVLEDPYDPPGLTTHPMKVPPAKERFFRGERTVAWLPHDFYLTYLPVFHEERPPIVYHQRVIVESFDKVPGLRP